MILIAIIIAAIAGYLFINYRDTEQLQEAVNAANIPDAVQKWLPDIAEAAKKYNVPFDVAAAVMWVESAGNPSAQGSAGEIGLMQLKQIAINDLELQNIGRFPGWDMMPWENIHAGVAYLSLQKKRAGTWDKAIMAYNQGYQGMQDKPELAGNYLLKVKDKMKFF